MIAQNTFDYTPDEPQENQPAEQPITDSEHEIIPPVEAGTALAVVEEAKKNNALVVALSTEKGLNPFIDKIKQRVQSETFDVTTEKGRKRIGSVARDIGEAKMDLKRMGQTLTEDWRTKTKAVTSEISRMEKDLDTLRDSVLAPRVEFEQREAARVSGHKQRLDVLAALPLFPDPDYQPTSAMIQRRIDQLADFKEIDWQEFTESYKATRDKVEAQLSNMLVTLKKAEEDASELARLRAAEDERNRALDAMYAAANTDNIAFDAAAKAKKDAEEEAERQRVAREAEVQKERDVAAATIKKAEEDRVSAHTQAVFQMAGLAKVPEQHTAAAVQSRLDTLKVIYGREWQEFKPEADEVFSVASKNLEILYVKAVDAEAEKQKAANKAIADKAAADEKKRADDAQKALDEAAAKRAADKAHKAKINNAAAEKLNQMLKIPISDAQAIVVAIAKGEIPNVTITY